MVERKHVTQSAEACKNNKKKEVGKAEQPMLSFSNHRPWQWALQHRFMFPLKAIGLSSLLENR